MLSGLALGALLMALGNRKVPAQVARERWMKLIVYFLIVIATLVCAAIGTVGMMILFAGVIGIATTEMWRATSARQFGRGPQRAAAWLVFVAIAAMAIAVVPSLSSESWVYLYLLIAVFDAFSQVVGQLAGQHRLAPKLSPGKTVEGAAGGLIATLVTGVLARDLVSLGAPDALLLAAAIAAAGLAGDLAASWVKRRAGIKDFGTLLPGQGGILDRYDSFLAASALLGPVMHAAGTP